MMGELKFDFAVTRCIARDGTDLSRHTWQGAGKDLLEQN